MVSFDAEMCHRIVGACACRLRAAEMKGQCGGRFRGYWGKAHRIPGGPRHIKPPPGVHTLLSGSEIPPQLTWRWERGEYPSVFQKMAEQRSHSVASEWAQGGCATLYQQPEERGIRCYYCSAISIRGVLASNSDWIPAERSVASEDVVRVDPFYSTANQPSSQCRGLVVVWGGVHTSVYVCRGLPCSWFPLYSHCVPV